MVKRKTADFVCAFLVFLIILLSIVLLTGESFFEGAAIWDKKEGVLTLFGTEFVLDKKLAPTAQKLLSFNDVVFVRGFSDVVSNILVFFAEYAADAVSLVYNLAKTAVGAV